MKINPEDYGTITEAARAAGVPRTTLATALGRWDDIESGQTHGGTWLVSIESAKRWAASVRKRGRPKNEA